MFPRPVRPSASPLPHVRGFPALRVLPASPTSIAASVSLRFVHSENILVSSKTAMDLPGSCCFLFCPCHALRPRRSLQPPRPCGGLLVPSKVLNLSASGLAFHEAQSLHLRYRLDSLCLRLTYVVAFTGSRLDHRWSGLPLSGMGISPIENTKFILAHQNVS